MMLSDGDFDKALQRIMCFDQTDITMAVLFTNGRSGSLLLHSLLDGHPELILIPKLIPYYYDEANFLKNYFVTPDDLVDQFMDASGFALEDASFSHYLGEDRSEALDFDSLAYRNLLKSLVRALPQITRKQFILAVHFAYALLKNQDLDDIKGIVLHHHHSITIYQDLHLKAAFDTPLMNALLDFPHLKFIHTVRNVYDMYHSSMRAYNVAASLYVYWQRIYLLLLGFYQAHYLDQCLGPSRYHYVRLEDIHTQTQATLGKLCEFLKIDYLPVLETSTFDGKKWWGPSPLENPMVGTNPNLKTNLWVGDMDDVSLALCHTLLKPFAQKFNYAIPPIQSACPNILWHWTLWESWAWKAQWRAFLSCPTTAVKEKYKELKFILGFPFARFYLFWTMLKMRDQLYLPLHRIKFIPFWLRLNAPWMRCMTPYADADLWTVPLAPLDTSGK